MFIDFPLYSPKIVGICNKFNLEKRLSLKSIDSTFDRLRELQILLKKESALKELCKKTTNKI